MGRSKNIAIAGCGIGGLAAAVLLRDQGHRVKIFDQFDRPRPVGSALIIQPTGQAILDELGLLSRARALGHRIDQIEGRRAGNERLILDAHYGRKDPTRFGLAIHRGALFELLFEAAIGRGAQIEQDALVLAIEHPGDPYLRFEGNREEGPFDLVIDAMGAKSPSSPLIPMDLSFGALWGVVDLPPGEDNLGPVLQQRYRKAHTMAGIMPIGKLPGSDTQKAAVFWSMRRDNYDAWLERDLEDWKAEVYEFWPTFEYYISGMSHHRQLTFATYAHGSLRFWMRRRWPRRWQDRRKLLLHLRLIPKHGGGM